MQLIIILFLSLTMLVISMCRLPPTVGDNNFTSVDSGRFFPEGYPVTLPGCTNKCGNLTVPYPFGIKGVNSTTSCSINPFFDINCNSSFDPPKAFLGPNKLEVLGISDTIIRIKNNQLGWYCLQQNGTGSADMYMDLSGTPFSFSNENQLTVVGCDDVSLMSTGMNEDDDRDYVSSCAAVCSKIDDVRNGSCSGIGCCQSSMPKSLRTVYASIAPLNGHKKVKDFNPCGYTFLAEKNSYTFSISDISDPSFMDGTRETVVMSLVIDWAIGDRTCDQFLNIDYDNEKIICQEKSVCVDSGTSLGGYRCNCSQGYWGNPYLSPGCQDINECCRLDTCHRKATCINLPGSYNCSCPLGYLGDGTVMGTGCTFMLLPTNTTLHGGLLGGLGLFLLLAASFWLYKLLKKRRAKNLKQHRFKRNGGLLLHQQISVHDSVLEKIRIFTSKELEKATDRFNESRILGRGGQGTVYKGMLSDGRIVAVKKSKLVQKDDQLAEFINEVVILSQINHRNVVRLLGCCLETEVPLLVSEFIPNGTLYHLIHEDATGFPFSWDLRLRIAAEIASALGYLHYSTPIPIYHRDMKSNNILLDEKYRAKLSDFGISRSVAVDETHLTTKVKGTFGYIDPEYFQTGKFTEKSDVYSFGVVLVELLTGRKPVSTCTTEDLEESSLVMRFLLTVKENRLKTILDSRITDQGVKEEHVVAVADLAKRCLSLNGRKRPTIREVATELEGMRTCENPSSVESDSQDISWTDTGSAVLSDDVSAIQMDTEC